MAIKKTKKIRPSKIFNSAISWLNTYLEIIAGGGIKTQRRRLMWLMPVSILAPFVGIFSAWEFKIMGMGSLSPIIMVVWVIVTIIPWLLLTWITLALYVPLIALSIPAEYSQKLKELNASPEVAKKIATRFMDIISWILFAGLYCYFFQVWNNILAVIPLILVAIFLLFSALGKWVEPDPKFKKKLWLAVVFLILMPLTLSFIKPNFYYYVFGRSPSELSNAYNKTQTALEKLQKTIKKKDDDDLASSLRTIERLTSDGVVTTDSARIVAKKVKKQLSNNSLLGKTGAGLNTVIDGIKKIVSSKGDTTIIVTHLVKPGQVIWEKTLSDPSKVFDSEIQLTFGSGVFIKNSGPGRIRVLWADFDADLDPGQRYAINFTKNRPGATIQFQLLTGDSAHVAVMS